MGGDIAYFNNFNNQLKKEIEENKERVALEKYIFKDFVRNNSKLLSEILLNEESVDKWICELYSKTLNYEISNNQFKSHIFNLEQDMICIIELPKVESDVVYDMIAIVKHNGEYQYLGHSRRTVIHYLLNGMRATYILESESLESFYDFLKNLSCEGKL